MKKKKCSTIRLTQKVYERDFYSHVFANPVRHLTIIPRAQMGSESIAYEAEGREE